MENNIYIEIANKIIAIPDNKPEHAADHKLKATTEIVARAMRMAERNYASQFKSSETEIHNKAIDEAIEKIDEWEHPMPKEFYFIELQKLKQ